MDLATRGEHGEFDMLPRLEIGSLSPGDLGTSPFDWHGVDSGEHGNNSAQKTIESATMQGASTKSTSIIEDESLDRDIDTLAFSCFELHRRCEENEFLFAGLQTSNIFALVQVNLAVSRDVVGLCEGINGVLTKMPRKDGKDLMGENRFMVTTTCLAINCVLRLHKRILAACKSIHGSNNFIPWPHLGSRPYPEQSQGHSGQAPEYPDPSKRCWADMRSLYNGHNPGLAVTALLDSMGFNMLHLQEIWPKLLEGGNQQDSDHSDLGEKDSMPRQPLRSRNYKKDAGTRLLEEVQMVQTGVEAFLQEIARHTQELEEECKSLLA